MAVWQSQPKASRLALLSVYGYELILHNHGSDENACSKCINLNAVILNEVSVIFSICLKSSSISGEFRRMNISILVSYFLGRCQNRTCRPAPDRTLRDYLHPCASGIACFGLTLGGGAESVSNSRNLGISMNQLHPVRSVLPVKSNISSVLHTVPAGTP